MLQHAEARHWVCGQGATSCLSTAGVLPAPPCCCDTRDVPELCQAGRDVWVAWAPGATSLGSGSPGPISSCSSPGERAQPEHPGRGCSIAPRRDHPCARECCRQVKPGACRNISPFPRSRPRCCSPGLPVTRQEHKSTEKHQVQQLHCSSEKMMSTG